MDALKIGFEHGETLTVPNEFVGAFYLDDVQPLDGTGGYRAGQVVVSLDRDIMTAKITAGDGISYVQRVLGYGGEDDCYWCAGGGDGALITSFQQSKLNRHGDLFLVIGEDTEVLDALFPDETINAAAYVVPCLASAKRQQVEERAKRMPRKTVFGRFKVWLKNISKAWYSIRKGAVRG